MVLTAAQTTNFFEQQDQMGVPQAMVIHLQAEGIQSVADLADFEKDSLQQLADNSHHPGQHILDPKPNGKQGVMIPIPPFT